MKRFRPIASWCAALLLTAAPVTHAQREPHIAYVYPAGGLVGTSFDVTVAGQFLANITNAYVSGSDIKAIVIPYEPIISRGQQQNLRERLQELSKMGRSADVLKEITNIRRKLATLEKQRIQPALAEMVPVQITIGPNAAPGNHELRLASYGTLSNPLVFQVGLLPEFTKPEELLNDNVPVTRRTRETRAATNTAVRAITLPATVNGQIMPGGVDRYRFKARQGQQLVISVNARELIPYLADAVPGWFQAKIVLYDGQGKELVYDDHYRFHPDPVLFYTIPKEGEYILEIRDSIYRGREDFVYRVTIGELPFISNVFPLGGRANEQLTVAIWGHNLPADKYSLNLTGVEPGLYPFTLANKGQQSNRVAFMVDTIPECFKKTPSNSPTNAQYLTLPIIVNGHIDNPGDVDVFRFDGRAGDRIVAEIHARRLDSPLDSALKLTDATGKQIAFNDDYEDKGSGLNTHHADSYITATLPTTGTYYLYLWDTQQKGGWAYSYRLRVSAPRPDFELRAVPSSISARPGNTASITVYALRRDGCTNSIAITLKNPPEGFKLSSGSLVGTQEQIRLSLTIPSKASKTATNLNLEGRSTLLGRTVVHRVIPADDMMQAFLYRHLVLANELKVLVASPAPPRPTERRAESTPPPGPAIKIPAGGSTRVQLKLPTTYTGKLQLELDEPPDGISIKSFTPMRDSVEIVLQTAAAKVKSGQKGELLINAFAERTNVKTADGKPRTRLGTLPSVRFEIVAK